MNKNDFYSNKLQQKIDIIQSLINKNKELLAESDAIIGKYFDTPEPTYQGEDRRQGNIVKVTA